MAHTITANRTFPVITIATEIPIPLLVYLCTCKLRVPPFKTQEYNCVNVGLRRVVTVTVTVQI